MTEAEFQAQVTQLAELCGWQWVHFRHARTKYGWEVPVSGPLGKGWPDLMLSRERDRRIIFVELKAGGSKPKPEQELVLAHLEAAGAMAYVWRPEDWKLIELTLR